MKHNDMIEQLKGMICETANVKRDDIDNIVLFNPVWGLEPREVVYFFLLIQERMGVTFSQQEINDISFFTLNNIAERIEKTMVDE